MGNVLFTEAGEPCLANLGNADPAMMPFGHRLRFRVERVTGERSEGRSRLYVGPRRFGTDFLDQEGD
jgi:hypothetical protein